MVDCACFPCYKDQVSTRVEMSAPTKRPRASSRYVPPSEWTTLQTASFGFRDGFVLRVPELYAAGDLSLLTHPSVAVVGSRDASEEGCRRAARLARELVAAKVVVMSGLAAGIDAAAHRAAIESGGRTIAVTAMPLDRAYPAENASLQMAIYRHHLLLTPSVHGRRVFPKDFPERNRVMARLARATVVIEAGDTSGSLHQVAEAISLQRDVFLPRSIVESKLVTWPARFAKDKCVHVFDSSQEVIAQIIGG